MNPWQEYRSRYPDGGSDEATEIMAADMLARPYSLMTDIIDAGRMLYGVKIGAVNAATDAIEFYGTPDRCHIITAVY